MPARAKRPPSPRSTRPSRPRPSAQSGGARGTDRNARSATAAEPQRGLPAINCICSRGNTDSRNENVSRSMIRKSRNVSVSCRMSELEVRQRDQDHDEDQRKRRADAGPLQHDQQEAVHEHPRQHGQRDRKRPVFGGQENRERRQMDGRIRPASAKNRTPRDCAARLSPIPGPATADISSKPLDETGLDQ